MGPLSERISDRFYQEKVVLSLSSVLGFILVWYAVTDIFRLMPPIVLPSPEKVFYTIYEKIFVSVGEEKLFGHVGVSLIRILVGPLLLWDSPFLSASSWDGLRIWMRP